jgi:TonB family protein
MNLPFEFMAANLRSGFRLGVFMMVLFVGQQGFGAEKNIEIGQLLESAKAGDPVAQYKAGEYFSGMAGESSGDAYFWFALAARADVLDAKHRRDALGEKIGEAERRRFNLMVADWRATPSATSRSVTDLVPPKIDLPKSPTTDTFYPESLRRAGVEGAVVLRFCVAATGTLSGIPEIQTSSGVLGLDDAAVMWAKQAKYIPGKKAGKPTNACAGIRVRFSLSSSVNGTTDDPASSLSGGSTLGSPYDGSSAVISVHRYQNNCPVSGWVRQDGFSYCIDGYSVQAPKDARISPAVAARNGSLGVSTKGQFVVIHMILRNDSDVPLGTISFECLRDSPRGRMMERAQIWSLNTGLVARQSRRLRWRVFENIDGRDCRLVRVG